MRLWQRLRGRHLDHRVAAAEAEAERSRERQEAVRRHIVAPLREAARRNEFAESIARSLAINGKGGRS